MVAAGDNAAAAKSAEDSYLRMDLPRTPVVDPKQRHHNKIISPIDKAIQKPRTFTTTANGLATIRDEAMPIITWIILGSTAVLRAGWDAATYGI